VAIQALDPSSCCLKRWTQATFWEQMGHLVRFSKDDRRVFQLSGIDVPGNLGLSLSPGRTRLARDGPLSPIRFAQRLCADIASLQSREHPVQCYPPSLRRGTVLLARGNRAAWSLQNIRISSAPHSDRWRCALSTSASSACRELHERALAPGTAQGDCVLNREDVPI
jgi:hypothetical protein